MEQVHRPQDRRLLPAVGRTGEEAGGVAAPLAGTQVARDGREHHGGRKEEAVEVLDAGG